MNLKQGVFRLLILIVILYAWIYLDWYSGYGSLGVDHIWYITWNEYLSNLIPGFLRESKIILHALAIVVFGIASILGIFYILFGIDRYLGKSNVRSSPRSETQ